jgi:hypothetical protein
MDIRALFQRQVGGLIDATVDTIVETQPCTLALEIEAELYSSLSRWCAERAEILRESQKNPIRD